MTGRRQIPAVLSTNVYLQCMYYYWTYVRAYLQLTKITIYRLVSGPVMPVLALGKTVFKD